MSTIAEQLVSAPTPELEKIAADVQEVANDTQSFAYRFEDQEDGSRIEIRAAAVPRISVDAPSSALTIDQRLEGALAKTQDGLFRLLPHNPGGVPNGDGETHDWVPADTRTRAFHDELEPGTPALVAHPA